MLSSCLSRPSRLSHVRGSSGARPSPVKMHLVDAHATRVASPPSLRGARARVQALRLAVLIVAGAALLVPTIPARAQIPSQDFFPIGVHSQPMNSFSKWKGRGVNSLIQYESNGGTVSMKQWGDAAAAQGLYYARWPSSNPANDLQEKYLMAWTQLDEPDLENHNPNPAYNIDIYQNLKAISPTKPVYVNFSGRNVTRSGADYTQWDKSGDWLSMDWYPYNWNPNTYGPKFIGQGIDKLRADAKGAPKRYFAVIECSNQRENILSRAPTPAEFRGEVWEAIVHGATGIVYFPQQVPYKGSGYSFAYDATPADIEAEMKVQNARIQGLARVLNSSFNPSGHSAASTDTRLESTWRVTQQGDYYIVLNLSSATITNATMTLTGVDAGINVLEVVGEKPNNVQRYETLLPGNTIQDTFAPWEVHVYRAAPGLGGAGVPEPGTVTLLGIAAGGLLLRRRRRAA